jgi:hypothetical protein
LISVVAFDPIHVLTHGLAGVTAHTSNTGRTKVEPHTFCDILAEHKQNTSRTPVQNMFKCPKFCTKVNEQEEWHLSLAAKIMAKLIGPMRVSNYHKYHSCYAKKGHVSYDPRHCCVSIYICIICAYNII